MGLYLRRHYWGKRLESYYNNQVEIWWSDENLDHTSTSRDDSSEYIEKQSQNKNLEGFYYLLNTGIKNQEIKYKDFIGNLV